MANARGTLLELLGVDPASAVGVEFAASPPSFHSDGLQRLDLQYTNMLGETVPAIALVPEGATPHSTCGAVVCIAGTSGDAEQCVEPTLRKLPPSGASRGPMCGWASELSRRCGVVTLSITLRGHDARNGRKAEDAGEEGAYEAQWGTAEKLMRPFGQTMMGVMTDEVLRGVDALPRACACVDPQRIAVTGFSLGGNLAWYSAACSTTIAASAPLCGGVGSMRTQIKEGDPNRHSDYFYIPHFLRHFDHPQVVAECITPRPLFIFAPTLDEGQFHKVGPTCANWPSVFTFTENPY
jgi:cephalosporin-C deacetylase-like acetyl esterase